ncbi:MaoC family dehydratase N-terminal domain-containing protein [Chelativorans sp. AA-79]|uniref:FAS1-like dehydratase domain-containing protein n=1 Tax=Chelativorans sp. AA-79 TaxID=3028735 RepID=UPI0023F9E644|nr:MaoC family dehydratase N-terminal domain-containing protein [Chelativorans sp. AA-79]WEX08076.1 MaoC family dehydratase N-terminal domain-containing protein [Chelativorans sp. AA-79]
MEKPLEDWIGKSETRRDVLTVDTVARFLAMLDRDDLPLGEGEPAPPLSHWLAFLPREKQSELGPDGHAKRGGFLPPVHHLPRRMWAGSRLDFRGALPVGAVLERRSTIASVERKEGRGGELVFVTVRHEIGRPDGPVLVTDEHDIVYRGLLQAAAAPAQENREPGEWRRSLMPDPVLLFRYSALTFNGHRIHYDRPYVTDVEGYPGLVVHGPLTATLLLDLVRRRLPAARVETFSFRAVSPLFDGREMHLNGNPPDAEGKVDLWATNAEGGLAMTATALVEA